MTLLIAHIPKTAGTSLKSLITDFKNDTLLIYENQLALGNPNIDFIANFQKKEKKPEIIMGHFSYGVHRFLNLKPRYVTVLREPVSRVISLYNFLRMEPNSPFTPYFNGNPSLKEFVSSGITEMTNNHMCRVIAGIPPDSGMEINEEWLLHLALHNLRHYFELVGVVERLDIFHCEIKKIVGLPNTVYPKLNISKNNNALIDEDLVNLIKSKNQLDIKLYNYINKLT